MTPLLELYKQYTGCTADSLQCIAGSGSNREYYRMGSSSVIEPVEMPEEVPTSLIGVYGKV